MECWSYTWWEYGSLANVANAYRGTLEEKYPQNFWEATCVKPGKRFTIGFNSTVKKNCWKLRICMDTDMFAFTDAQVCEFFKCNVNLEKKIQTSAAAVWKGCSEKMCHLSACMIHTNWANLNVSLESYAASPYQLNCKLEDHLLICRIKFFLQVFFFQD
jgi:hypothetical protein